MSQQYDDYMVDRFELYGKMYELVDPQNLDEFIEALSIKNIIQTGIDGLMHDEDSSGFCDLLQRQEDYIDAYLESLGEFDNSILVHNINYLVKKYDMRLGDLESFLGISAGYISRTAKVNSSKKMSIDVVWKLAQIFETDIQTLTSVEMSMHHNNTDLIGQFLEKLYEDTECGFIAWENNGGVIYKLAERFVAMGLVTESADDKTVYHPLHLNQELRWIVNRDIYSLENFDGGKDLVIIPYQAFSRPTLKGFDCYFVWEKDGKWQWVKVFSTNDDPMGYLNDKANKLYQLIEDQEFDVKMKPEIKNIISNYVYGERFK